MTKFHFPKSSHHFSIDDVFNSLIEVSDQNIHFFSHPFFKFIKSLHDQFGTNINLYCFYQREIDGKVRTLKDVSGRIKQTIQNNPWMRFGPHALDYPTAPYAQKPRDAMRVFDMIYHEIRRFAGDGNYSRLVRLHYFSELYELANYFRRRGVDALLSTDKNVFSHRMPEKIKQALGNYGFATYQGMTFVRTHFRIETFTPLRLSDKQTDKFLNNFKDQYGSIIFFTHEYDVPNPGIKSATVSLLNKCKNFKLRSI